MSRPIIGWLPVTQLDGFVCRQFDRVSYIFTRCGLASIGCRFDLISSQFGWYAAPTPAPPLATPVPPNPEIPDNPPDVLYSPPHSHEDEPDPLESTEDELGSAQSPGDEPAPPQTSECNNPASTSYGPQHHPEEGLNPPKSTEDGLASAQSTGDEPVPQQSAESNPSFLERRQIVGGFVLPYEQCLAWYQRNHDVGLDPDHSEDLTIPLELDSAIENLGYNWVIECAQSNDAQNHDFLLVTQRIHGQFRNLGPEGEEEVLQDDLKDVLKRGEEEDLARSIFLQKLRRWLLY